MSVVDFLRGPRRELLEALIIEEASAIPSALCELTDVPSGSIQYHLHELADRGYVEHVGERETPSGQWARVWAITDDGREAFEAFDERGEAVITVSDLESRIETLEAENERMKEQLDELTPDDETPL